jgi:hypothetical protein
VADPRRELRRRDAFGDLELLDRGGRLQGRVAPQDGRVQPLQLRAGVSSQRVDQLGHGDRDTGVQGEKGDHGALP